MILTLQVRADIFSFIGSQWKEQALQLPIEEVAFYHNLNALLNQLEKDNVKALLVPFHSNPNQPYEPQEGVDWMNAILRRIAKERNVSFAPLSSTYFASSDWIDNCHLNEKGSLKKAEFLVPYVRSI